MFRVTIYCILGLAAVLGYSNGEAQVLQVLGSGGGSGTVGGYTIDFTVGEAVIATVGTAPICTEGFNQPLTAADLPDSNLRNAKWYIKVFPNPVQGQLKVHAFMDVGGKLSMRLIDIMGRTVMSREMSFIQGYNDVVLNFGSVARGIYVLYISDAIHGGHQAIKLLKD